MMPPTLLHVPNLGVDVIYIVEAIFIFGLSSFREVGGKIFFIFFRVSSFLKLSSFFRLSSFLRSF